MTSNLDRIPELALEWHNNGSGAVLATVVETWGSAPRRAGSQMVVSAAGVMEGSVSGGCVEGAVVAEALEALSRGTAELLEFGVADEDAFAVGLACGGRIRILVEPVGAVIPVDVLETLVQARAARQQMAYLVNMASGERRLVSRAKAAEDTALLDRFAKDRSGFDGDWFIGIHSPGIRLAVVGAVHITQALMPMARLAGFDPVLVDPRPGFAAASRFPGETIIEAWPDEGLQQIGLDPRAGVITLTHDPKLDDPAIKAALASEAFYIGALGSNRTHAKRVQRLIADGFSNLQIARIHAPVGLDIGAANPAEIAVSILAEVIQRLRRT